MNYNELEESYQIAQKMIAEDRVRITQLEECLRDMLDALNSLTKDVNWARSVIQADTIRKINEVPIRARTLLGIADTRDTVKTCAHGHLAARVGCVSCALVFDIKPQTE